MTKIELNDLTIERLRGVNFFLGDYDRAITLLIDHFYRTSYTHIRLPESAIKKVPMKKKKETKKCYLK